MIPTYNEAENLPRIVPILFDLPLDLSLLVVDDGSPDGTGDIADELSRTYRGRFDVIHRTGKLGLGTAYICAFKHALQGDSETIGQMDADFSHAPQKIVELAEALEHCDMSLGSRYIPGGGLDERWPLWRQGLSKFGNLYARVILGLPFKDVTGGFRLWRRETLEGMPLDSIRSNGYIFQVEMAYVAHKLGYRFTEVPITFADRRWGTSKMSLRIQLEAALRVWSLLWRYRGLKPS